MKAVVGEEALSSEDMVLPLTLLCLFISVYFECFCLFQEMMMFLFCFFQCFRFLALLGVPRQI